MTSVAEGALYRVRPEQNAAEHFADTGGGANGAALAADGSILVTQNGGFDFAATGLFADPPTFRPATPGLQHVAAEWCGHLPRRRRVPLPQRPRDRRRRRDLLHRPAALAAPRGPGWSRDEVRGGRHGHRVRRRLLVLQRDRVRARRHHRGGRAVRAAARARRRLARVGDRTPRARRRRRFLSRRRRSLLRGFDHGARHPRRRPRRHRSSTSSRSTARASRRTAASAAPTSARCS